MTTINIVDDAIVPYCRTYCRCGLMPKNIQHRFGSHFHNKGARKRQKRKNRGTGNFGMMAGNLPTKLYNYFLIDFQTLLAQSRTFVHKSAQKRTHERTMFARRLFLNSYIVVQSMRNIPVIRQLKSVCFYAVMDRRPIPEQIACRCDKHVCAAAAFVII